MTENTSPSDWAMKILRADVNEYDNEPTADSNKLLKSGTIKTALDKKANTSHTHDAGQIKSGVFDVARIPPVALERLVVVVDDTARYALTTDTVQVGDTVKVTSSGYMYLVVDDTHLDTAAGYAIYTAGSIDAGQIISGTIDAARLPAGSNDFISRASTLSSESGDFVVLHREAQTTTHVVPGGGNLYPPGIDLYPVFTALPARVATNDNIFACDVVETSEAYPVFTISIAQSTTSLPASVMQAYDAEGNLLEEIDTPSLASGSPGGSATVKFSVSPYSIAKVRYVVHDIIVLFGGETYVLTTPEYTVYGTVVPAVL